MDDKPAPGPLAMFHRYLAARKAHLLAADAFVMLLLYALADHFWVASADVLSFQARSEPADSLMAATVRVQTVFRTLSTFCFYAAIFLLAWAAARLLAGSWRAGADRPEGK